MQVNYQTESDIRPNKYLIENILNGNCDIVINDKIKKVNETHIDDEGEEVTTSKYTFNSYRVTTPYRDTLEEELASKDGYNLWLNFVVTQATEQKAKEVRALRDELLNETDWTQMPDTALSEEKQEQYRIYRQALRDIPEQEGFPFDVVFPTL